MVLARALMRRQEKGKAYGVVTAKALDTLRGYVRDAEIFKDHAGNGLLYPPLTTYTPSEIRAMAIQSTAEGQPGNHLLVRAFSCGITLCVASRLSRDQARRIHTPPSTKRLARFRSDYLIESP